MQVPQLRLEEQMSHRLKGLSRTNGFPRRQMLPDPVSSHADKAGPRRRQGVHYADVAGRMDIRNAALGFSLGVVAAHWLPAAQALWACWLCAGACLLLARRARILGAAAIGLGWGAFNAMDAIDRRVDPSCTETTVTGRVIGLPARSPPGESHRALRVQRFVVMPATAGCAIEGAIRLTWFDGPDVRGGERWRFAVRLKRPRGTANAHGFDSAKWFVRNKLAATGYVVSGARVQAAEATGKGALADRVAAVRERLRESLGRLPLVNGGVIASLALGDSAAIPRPLVELYQRTGTMHLLVISGLHVGIVTAFGFLLGRWAGLLAGFSPRSGGVAAALAFAAGYVILAGAGLSLLRAFAMATAGMFALVAGRSAAPSSVLAYALALVLAVDPMAPLAVGFWLSFGAVSVLLGYFAPRPRPRSWLVSALLAQLAIAVVFVPAATGITGLVHPLGIGVNLVAVPVVTLLVVPLSLAGVALLATSMGPWLLYGADFCLSLVGEVLAFADSVAPIYVAAPGAWLPCLVLTAGACLLPVSRSAGIALVGAMAALLLFSGRTTAPGHVDVTMLDVGQGTAVLVETAHHALIYDAGPSFPAGGDAGKSVVLPTLRGRGRGYVDRLILSHSDLDHVGGAVAVLSGVRVGAVLAGEPVPGIEAEPCHAGMRWRWDGIAFSVLSPPVGHAWTGNNASCVLLIEAASTRVLLAGDIEAVVEESLAPPVVDVLVVPHHGSATSSTQTFVARTRPGFAIVGAGFENRFGHPHPAVVERYRRVGTHILSTAVSGALRWNSSRPDVVTGERCGNPLYWRRDGPLSVCAQRDGPLNLSNDGRT